jgi:hypothetical protein
MMIELKALKHGAEIHAPSPMKILALSNDEERVKEKL